LLVTQCVHELLASEQLAKRDFQCDKPSLRAWTPSCHGRAGICLRNAKSLSV